jgi:hypothetical protein
VLESAFAMSQASGTPINSDDIELVTGASEWQLDFSYVPSLNPGTATGDLTVIVNGQIIPRRVVGSTQDAWYEEVSGNNYRIRFWDDLSVTDVSLEAHRRQGSIDSSDENATAIGYLTQSQIITSGPTTLTQQSYKRVIADSTGGAFTINLPASPNPGDVVKITDGGGTWATFNVTVGRNGNNISGAAADLTLNVNDSWVELEYYNVGRGWLVRT